MNDPKNRYFSVLFCRISLVLTIIGFLFLIPDTHAQDAADSSFSSYDSLQDLRLEGQDRSIDRMRLRLQDLYKSQEEALDSIQLLMERTGQHREFLEREAGKRKEEVSRLEEELVRAWELEKVHRKKLQRAFLIAAIIFLVLLITVFLVNRILGLRNRIRMKNIRAEMEQKSGELSSTIAGQEKAFLDALDEYSANFSAALKKQGKELKVQRKELKADMKSQKKIQESISSLKKKLRKKKKPKKYS